MRQVHSIRVHRRQRPRDGVVNSSVARLYRTILALLRVVIDEFRARVNAKGWVMIECRQRVSGHD
jgi:hypothetical protein